MEVCISERRKRNLGPIYFFHAVPLLERLLFVFRKKSTTIFGPNRALCIDIILQQGLKFSDSGRISRVDNENSRIKKMGLQQEL